MPQPRDVEETAADLRGNAALKALAYSDHGLAIASDGGLEAPALEGRWDLVRTQRQGQGRLRELLAGVTDRRARWHEAVAIADRGRLLACWVEAGTEGVLAAEPWPAPSALWVWDIFIFPALGKAWAELSAEERQRVDITWTRLRAAVQGYLATIGCSASYS